MEPPLDVGMKICSNVPDHMTKMASRPIYGKNLQTSILLLRNQETNDLDAWYTASVLKYYQICSNDSTGLTLTIFMTWPNLFPNASAWMKVNTAYSHVFPSLFSIFYALK